MYVYVWIYMCLYIIYGIIIYIFITIFESINIYRVIEESKDGLHTCIFLNAFICIISATGLFLWALRVLILNLEEIPPANWIQILWNNCSYKLYFLRNREKISRIIFNVSVIIYSVSAVASWWWFWIKFIKDKRIKIMKFSK